MRKIKIVTDSASDVPFEAEQKYGIKVLGFSVAVDGKAYTERKDFTQAEFFGMLKNCSRIPTTAQYTFMQFEELWEELWKEGWSDVIYIGLNAKASATFGNSLMARDSFYENHPEAKGEMNIHCVDSGTYSLGYGYPVVQAAVKAERGAGVQEILSYLDNWFACNSIFFTPYTLEYVKKSGRVSAAAAFVGELMGLKPVISFPDGESKVIDKVRGDKAVIPSLVKYAVKNMIPHTEYIILVGSCGDKAKVLAAEMEKAVGYPPAMVGTIGAAIAINAGPEALGILIKDKTRPSAR